MSCRQRQKKGKLGTVKDDDQRDHSSRQPTPRMVVVIFRALSLSFNLRDEASARICFEMDRPILI